MKNCRWAEPGFKSVHLSFSSCRLPWWYSSGQEDLSFPEMSFAAIVMLMSSVQMLTHLSSNPKMQFWSIKGQNNEDFVFIQDFFSVIAPNDGNKAIWRGKILPKRTADLMAWMNDMMPNRASIFCFSFFVWNSSCESLLLFK